MGLFATILILFTLVRATESAGSLELLAKFTISTTGSPSLLCSSQLPSCSPKGFYLNITVKINNKSPKSSNVMHIRGVNFAAKSKGLSEVKFDRRINLPTIPAPINSLELSLEFTPDCNSKCGKVAAVANGVIPIQLQSYKSPMEVADILNFGKSSSFQVTAGVSYRYKCDANTTGSNCNCMEKLENCAAVPFVCKSKLAQLCCYSVLKEEGFICYKSLLTSTAKTTTTATSTTTVETTATSQILSVVQTTADNNTQLTTTTSLNRSIIDTTADSNIMALLENFTSATDPSEFSSNPISNDTGVERFNLHVYTDEQADKVSLIVGLTVGGILLGLALIIGCTTLVYKRLRNKRPTGQTVTFYYEDGPYAEIDSEKWQNIVTLCASMDQVEGEIRKSITALSQASSSVSRPQSADQSLFDPNFNNFKSSNSSTKYAKPQKNLKSFKMPTKNDKKSPIEEYFSRKQLPMRRYKTRDKQDSTVGTSLFEEIHEAEEPSNKQIDRSQIADYSEDLGDNYNYITSSIQYINQLPKPPNIHANVVYRETTEPVYDCVYSSDSEEPDKTDMTPKTVKPIANACGTCKKCARLHRKSIAKSMPSLHEYENKG